MKILTSLVTHEYGINRKREHFIMTQPAMRQKLFSLHSFLHDSLGHDI